MPGPLDITADGAGPTAGSRLPAHPRKPEQTMSDEASPVVEHRDGDVSWITLNRPERMNAVTPALYEALGDVVESVAADESVRCVVLTGAGRAFCAGRDLKQPPVFAAASAGEWMGKRSAYLRRHARIATTLHTMPKPVIAMINGACAGAGLSLAGACDIRIAGEAAVLTSAFVRAGLSGDMGGTWFWSRILGSAKARRLYLMSERFDAAAAHAFGLVDRVVSDAALHAAVAEIAADLAATSPAALRLAKAALTAAEDATLETVLELEADSMAMAGVDLALTSGEIGDHA